MYRLLKFQVKLHSIYRPDEKDDNPKTATVTNSLSMQVLSGINIIFPALMLVWMYFMPRSPVFLMEKVQRAALAKTTLCKDDFWDKK